MKLTMPWTATETHPNGIGRTLDDVRRALSKEVGHLAQVAAQLGRDIGEGATRAGHDTGTQASVVAQGASGSAATFARRALTGATAIGPQLALLGQRRMHGLGRDVQTLGKDLRRVRLTTEPKRTSPDLMPGIALLGGFGAGLALMYLLDPDRGRRRRALLRAQLTKWMRIGRETAEGTANDVRNRTVGVMAQARQAVVPVGAATETTAYEYEPGAGNGYGSTQTVEAPEQLAARESTANVG